MHSTRAIAFIILASLGAGCSTPAPSPTSPSSTATGGQALTADQLAGTWRLSSMRRAGEPEQATPAGATYTLTFADGRLSTKVDCNTCGGGFALSGQTLTVGPALACTRAACPTMAFENAYTSMLSGDSATTMSGGMLVLTSPRGELRFTR